MTQTIKLRPMTKTPKRWPVLVCDTLARRPMLSGSYWSKTPDDEPSFDALNRLGVGWLYADELKFEVEE